MRICPTCRRRFPPPLTHCPDDGSRLHEQDQDQAPAPTPTPPVDSNQTAERPLNLDNRSVGPYRLDEVLAEGGMGIIFTAEHLRLGRRVALKMLKPEYAGNKMAIARFFREARAVNAIEHEHIIEITDFIEDDQGDNYYVMELLQGRSLKDLLEQEGRLPVPRTLDIATQTCDALAAVHAAKIVHRDLKPDNIFLTHRNQRQDFVKLLDFGVAKLLDEDEPSNAHKTQDGTVLGTASYMAPEQARGMPVDERADIYSLGVILYEALCGRKPIEGRSFSDLLEKKVGQDPLRPSALPEPVQLPLTLEDLIMGCLARNPDERPTSMPDLSERLLAIGREGSVAHEAKVQIVPAETNPPPGPGRSRLFFWLALSLLALGAAAAWMLWPTAAPPAATAVEIPAEPHVASAPGSKHTEPKRQDGTRQEKPAAGTHVMIGFISQPPGAKVTIRGQAWPLGKTPLVSRLPRSQDEQWFAFQLPGYKTEKRKIVPGSDQEVRVVLETARRTKAKAIKSDTGPKAPSAKIGGKELDLSGTINPFEQDEENP